MKKRSIIAVILCLSAAVLLISSISVFAITDSEVQQYVDANGKEAATGNVFIWFICAIAFLKISQKIDSFMGTLGISVGHTGGSMLSEALIAARTIGGIRHSSGGGSGGGGRTASSGGFMAGGLAGAVGRKFNAGAASAATGKEAGGIVGRMGAKAYEASVKNGGQLANDVIGSVAKGNIQENGTISGEAASDAIKSYMGISAESNSQVNANVTGGSVTKSVDNSSNTGTPVNGSAPGGGTIPTTPASGEIPKSPSDSIEGIPDTIPGMGGENVSPIAEGAGMTGLDAEIGMETAGIPLSPEAAADMAAGSIVGAEISETDSEESGGISSGPAVVEGEGTSIPPSPTIVAESAGIPSSQAPDTSDVSPAQQTPIAGSPSFENVEIGGGRITGTEKSAAHPGGIDFAMYHAEQYMAPQSSYEMVKMIDGSKWYKQYAMPTVEKTPHMSEKGKVEYTEKIVDKVPPVPKRKDRV